MSFLITRSEPHASKLATQLAALGVSSVTVPVMSIVPVEVTGAMRSHLMNLDCFDIVVLISANAADLFVAQVDQYWPQIPVGLQWVTIGQATAQSLAEGLTELSYSEIQIPEGTDSEALMSLKLFEQINEKKVLLVKGEGGRNHIQQTLTERGAKVTELVLYRRQPAMEFQSQLRTVMSSGPRFIQIASGDSFLNVLAMLGASLSSPFWQLGSTIWLVPSDRVAQLLTEHGIARTQISVCDGASNKAVLAQLETLLS